MPSRGKKKRAGLSRQRFRLAGSRRQLRPQHGRARAVLDLDSFFDTPRLPLKELVASRGDADAGEPEKPAGEAPGADPQTHRDMRPFDNFVKAGEDWRAIFEPETKAKW